MKSNSLQSGLIWGGVFAIIYLIFYIIGLSAFSSPWMSRLLFLTSVGLMIYFGLELKKANGGYLSFGKCFGHLALTILIGTVVSFVFNFILFGFIDPEFMESMKQSVLDKAIIDAEAGGAPSSTIEMMVSWIEWGFTPLGQFVYTLGFVAGYLVVALIVSLIIKKNKPEFA